jgi:hypothetical protein
MLRNDNASSPLCLLSACDDDDLLWLNTEGLQRIEQLRHMLSRVARNIRPEPFRRCSGDSTLAEGFGFYQLVERLAKENGSPVNSATGMYQRLC